MKFRDDFVWGAATAAYQIEGGKTADGKGPSIWDVFTSRQGVIKDGTNGDTACDHYGRMEEDVRLMAGLGLNGYRFSLSWPRIMPDGVTRNERGLDFYDRLTDRLLGCGIQPFATLYHWDLPQALHLGGGWLNRDIAGRFADYADVVGRRLGDRIKRFMTINEPQVFLNAGYITGTHAPGFQIGLDDELTAVHNVLLSHGAAAAQLRAVVPDVKIGWASAGYPGCPASDRPEDIRAAEEITFVYPDDHPCTAVAVFADPIERGDYDKVYYEKYRDHLPDIRQDDMRKIAQPVDFHGQNCYAGRGVYMGKDGPTVIGAQPGEALTQMQWNIYPDCLYWFPKMLHDRYHLPIYITENGVSYSDYVFRDGGVHDPARSEYLCAHISALKRAARDADVRGYFYWSLMDNFEWAEGYTQRFGLIHVDFATGKRTPKDSYETYRRIIASNGSVTEDKQI